MRKKGFTLVELLVVIAIIALLMSILMPSLSRVRQMANQVVCGTNLKGIGSAMMLYAGDFDNKYPRAAGDDSEWGIDLPSSDADATNMEAAYGVGPGNADQIAPTITASFYLLVRHDYTSADQFLCKSDTGVREFDAPNKELYWDFYDGQDFTSPEECCSYSLQLPYDAPSASVNSGRNYYLSPEKDPERAVAADRNPFITSDAAAPVSFGQNDDQFYWNPDNEGDQNNKRELKQNGNSPVHQKQGQNVLFNDAHVSFENWAFCAIENDNIYTIWASSNPGIDNTRDVQEGTFSTSNPRNNAPMDEEDSLLVNDPM